jgi:hypothetical protein
LNGFIFTLSFSHKKEMGSEKHTLFLFDFSRPDFDKAEFMRGRTDSNLIHLINYYLPDPSFDCDPGRGGRRIEKATLSKVIFMGQVRSTSSFGLGYLGSAVE